MAPVLDDQVRSVAIVSLLPSASVTTSRAKAPRVSPQIFRAASNPMRPEYQPSPTWIPIVLELSSSKFVTSYVS
ncbi:hypothetical protein RRF57_012493 [Xylaria bambusicola]|uniref:Uncharacterized protein n=1 Tax=Xylaria bambusicola TaxID=326684 RepID=A0AAN7V1T5_9PEZI